MPKNWSVVLVSRSFCIESAEGEMDNREPIEGLGAGWGAALATLLWALAGAMLLALPTAALPSLGCLLLTPVGALLATLASTLSTIVKAGHNRDWLSASALVVILALSFVALYALLHAGEPEHTFVNELYGFSPDVFAFHPFAYGASFALMVLPAPVTLAYHLLHERARRANSLVSLATLVGAVGLLVAIRLAPAAALPT